MAGATGLEPATSGVTGVSEFNDFNDLAQLAYQNVLKWVKSWSAFAPWVHPTNGSELNSND